MIEWIVYADVKDDSVHITLSEAWVDGVWVEKREVTYIFGQVSGKTKVAYYVQDHICETEAELLDNVKKKGGLMT